uniref:MIP36727p1 n=1 Tax=Drosophila melanogaster TaxID=7227 RepID=R9ULR9_DROME|nr:MIP36727p1 [Drosophila melanogaster]
MCILFINSRRQRRQAVWSCGISRPNALHKGNFQQVRAGFWW